jgi:hypothetical protein
MSSDHLIIHVPERIVGGEFQLGQMAAMGLYRILQDAGEILHGHIYHAWDMAEGRAVAIKVLKEDLADSEAAINELGRKIHSIHQSAHPTFILPHEVVRLENRTLVIEEWVNGLTLLKLLKSRGSLPVSEAVQILKPLAEGIDFAINGYHHHIDLTLRHVLIDFAGEDAFPEGKSATELRVTNWPPFDIKFSPLTLSHSSKVKEPISRAFGKIFFQSLGGHPQRPGSTTYIPLPQLSEEGNAHLRSFLTSEDAMASCATVLRKVCEAESVVWPADRADHSAFAHRVAAMANQTQVKRERIQTLSDELSKLPPEPPIPQQAPAPATPEPTAPIEPVAADDDSVIKNTGTAPNRSKLLFGSLAGVALAAAGGYAFWTTLPPQLNKQPVALEVANSFEDVRGELETLRQQENWPELYARIPDITQQFTGDSKLALMEIAKASITPLFETPNTWPAAKTTLDLDAESREIVGQALTRESVRLASVASPAETAKLLSYHEEAFPQRPIAEVASLRSDGLSKMRSKLEKGKPLSEPESRLLEHLAGSDTDQEATFVKELAATQAKEEKARQDALSQAQRFQEEQQLADQLQKDKQWRTLFDRLETYAGFPGDTNGELRKLAESSVAPLFADFSDAPAPSEVAKKESDIHELVSEALAARAAQPAQSATSLSEIYSYVSAINPSETNASLLETGKTLTTNLASKGTSMNSEERQLLRALATYGVSGAGSLQEKLSTAEEALKQEAEAWEALSSELGQLANRKDWLGVFALLDDQRFKPFQEKHASTLEQVGNQAAQALCQDATALPSRSDVIALESLGQKYLRDQLSLAGTAAANRSDIEAFGRYLSCNRELFPDTPNAALATAGNALASSNPSDDDLKTLASLGISKAADILQQRRQASTREAKFTTTLSEARQLAESGDWPPLFARLDAYLTDSFTEGQKRQLLAIGRPAVEAVYRSSSGRPSAKNVSRFPSLKKDLIAEVLLAHAQTAVSQGSINAFVSYLEYQRAAFSSTPSTSWQQLGTQTVNLLKRDFTGNRPLIDRLNKNGIKAAATLLSEMATAEKRKQFEDERSDALAIAGRDPGDALRRFISFKQRHFGGAWKDWKRAYQRDIDGILTSVRSGKGIERELKTLESDGFTAAKRLLADLAPKTIPLEQMDLQDFRKKYAASWKDKKFVGAYMNKAVQKRSAEDIESAALTAISIGLVDNGFSALDILVTRMRVPLSRKGKKRLLGEFGNGPNPVARTGWHGLWLMRGNSPVKVDVKKGVEKLAYAAKRGHKPSQRICDSTRPKINY